MLLNTVLQLHFSGHLAAQLIANCVLIKLLLVQKQYSQQGAPEPLKAKLETSETARPTVGL